MDDLAQFCCQNPDCPDFGRRGGDHLSVTARYGKNKERRMLYCRSCKGRFSERKGTIFFGSRLPEATIVSMMEHVTEGCGVSAGRPLRF